MASETKEFVTEMLKKEKRMRINYSIMTIFYTGVGTFLAYEAVNILQRDPGMSALDILGAGIFGFMGFKRIGGFMETNLKISNLEKMLKEVKNE